jgi:hypothetical protein
MAETLLNVVNEVELGQVMLGLTVSTILMVQEHVLVFPVGSVAVQEKACDEPSAIVTPVELNAAEVQE